MRTLLITGARGFIGQSLIETIRSTRSDILPLPFDLADPPETLTEYIARADAVIHLAGVNRPQDVADFVAVNADWSKMLLEMLEAAGRATQKSIPLILSSSTQATLSNPYGESKRAAEEAVFAYGKRTGADVFVYRFPNVFGKWSRPNYNSAVATFCHNIARGLPITVNDPAAPLTLVYIDDVVAEILAALDGKPNRVGEFCEVPVSYHTTVGAVAETFRGFARSREERSIPELSDDLTRKLYATYLSFLPTDGFSYALDMHADARGSFTEFLRTPDRGQVSVNVSKPGIVKGNHWHHTKVEKFLVVSGRGVIRFRAVGGTEVVSYPVSGDRLEVVDIPAGYTHNIENTGDTDLVTVMWASEPFDPAKPDTFPLGV